jgi:hypothetical protein
MFERFSHKKKIMELEEAVAKLQRDFSSLEMTWLDTQHKLKSILGRVVKSDALAGKEREDAMMGIAPAQFPSSGPHGPGGGNGMLSDNQKKIQQQILRRRAGS